MEKKEVFPLKKSIGIKLIATIFSIYIFVAIFIHSFHWNQLYNEQIKILKRELRAYKKSFEKTLSVAMFSEDEEQQVAILEGVSTLPGIERVILFDDEKKIMVKSGEIADEETLIEVTELIKHKDEESADKNEEVVGYIKLVSSQKYLINRFLKGAVVSTLIVELIKAFLFLLLFVFIFRIMLMKPFKKLAEFAKQTNFENMEVLSLGFKKGDENEFTVVEKSMNEMIFSLKKSKEESNSHFQKVIEMNYELEESNSQLEEKVKERTKEVTDYLDNMTNAVFSIEKDYKVHGPISNHTEKIFGLDIQGKRVSEFLFSSLKRGSQELTQLKTTLDLIFGTTKIQFLALEDNLPKRVKVFNPKSNSDKVLKLSYAPLCSSNDIVERLMIIAEDFSEAEAFHKKTQMDQLSYFFLKEVLLLKGNENISKFLEYSINESLMILEKFISPLSDTYNSSFFKEELRNLKIKLDKELYQLVSLKKQLDEIVPEEWVMEDLPTQKKINYQSEATEKVCGIIENLMRYANSAKFVLGKVNYTINKNIVRTLDDKIGDLHKTFKNLFEYIFLIREIYQIDEDKLKKAANLARLYPDFEKTMDLINQRSRFVSFLLKVLLNEDYSEKFEALSKSVRLIPDKSKLNEKIIKNNLINPYKDILEQAKLEKEKKAA